MLKQTIVCLLSCGFLLSSTQAMSRTSYSYEVDNHYNASNCQATHDVFYLINQCIKKNASTHQGLLNQINYLKKTWRAKRKKNVSSSPIPRHQLVTSVKALLQWHEGSTHLADHFELRELQGGNDRQVKMTGYYTPILAARRSPNSQYKYPIYRTPKGSKRFLSRAAIDAGKLAHLGLEIAWVADPIDLFYVHVQGSGILQFPNGQRRVLRYSTSNNKPFRKISTYMQRRGFLNGNKSRRAITQWLRANPTYLNEVLAYNPRYVFFKEHNSLSTASGMGLIAGHTVAVDTKHIPFGSVLLAEIPVNTHNGVPRYEWRLLFPQDRGIDIKGGARLDLYTGKGEAARQMANTVTGARRVYLLLSRASVTVAMKR